MDRRRILENRSSRNWSRLSKQCMKRSLTCAFSLSSRLSDLRSQRAYEPRWRDVAVVNATFVALGSALDEKKGRLVLLRTQGERNCSYKPPRYQLDETNKTDRGNECVDRRKLEGLSIFWLKSRCDSVLIYSNRLTAYA